MRSSSCERGKGEPRSRGPHGGGLRCALLARLNARAWGASGVALILHPFACVVCIALEVPHNPDAKDTETESSRTAPEAQPGGWHPITSVSALRGGAACSGDACPESSHAHVLRRS